jgi:hypothetical protein
MARCRQRFRQAGRYYINRLYHDAPSDSISLELTEDNTQDVTDKTEVVLKNRKSCKEIN